MRDCSGPREVVQIDQFLKETAAREASAKLRLQQFIEELLERADRAERQLQVISSSCGSTPSASLGRGGGGSGAGPGARGPGRMVSARCPQPTHLTTTACPHIQPHDPWSASPSFGSSLESRPRPKVGVQEQGTGLIGQECQSLKP